MFRRRICEATSSLSVKRRSRPLLMYSWPMVAFRFSRRSGSRVSIYQDIRHLRVLPVSTEVSRVILCPLAQPNKAIGLESHIGSWLACYLEPTVLLAQLHEPRASSHHRDMKPRKQNPQLAWVTLKKYATSPRPRRLRDRAGCKPNRLPLQGGRGEFLS